MGSGVGRVGRRPAARSAGAGWRVGRVGGRIGLMVALLCGAAPRVSVGQVIRFNASSDTYVDATAPLSNLDSDTRLRVDASPERIAYLRFDVTGVGARRVALARLRLDATSGSAVTGGEVRAVADVGWNAASVTFANRPAVGAVLDTLGAVASGTVVAFDLGSAVPGDGAYAFAITTTSRDGIAYRSLASSKGVRPELELTLGGEDEPMVTIVQPVDRSILRAGTTRDAAGDAPNTWAAT